MLLQPEIGAGFALGVGFWSWAGTGAGAGAGAVASSMVVFNEMGDRGRLINPKEAVCLLCLGRSRQAKR